MKLIKGLELRNIEKLARVYGKLGENASDEAVLVEYDKLGGLIVRQGIKVKRGVAYDVSARKARAELRIVLDRSYDENAKDEEEEVVSEDEVVSTEHLQEVKKEVLPDLRDEVVVSPKKAKKMK